MSTFFSYALFLNEWNLLIYLLLSRELGYDASNKDAFTKVSNCV